ncbi:STAS domain-containing protein [Streptomyces populi]
MTREPTVRTRTPPAGPVVKPAGALDHHGTPDIRGPLPGLCPGRQLVVDLGRLTLCDSTGVTVLVAARRTAPRMTRRLQPPSPRTRHHAGPAVQGDMPESEACA